MAIQQQVKLAQTSQLYKSAKQTNSLKMTVPEVFVEMCGMTENYALESTSERVDGECILKVKLVKKK